MEANLANLIEANSDPGDIADPVYLDYLDSLPANGTAVLEYAVDVIELGECRADDVPSTVLAAARLAAGASVPLDAVLRHYAAGNAFFGDILVEEAEQVGASPSALRRMLPIQAIIFDRLHEAVGEAYVRAEPAGHRRRAAP